MDKAIWKVLAFMLCAVLMFLFPLMTVLDNRMISPTISYWQSVIGLLMLAGHRIHNTGNVLEFTDRIESTGNTYSIKMSHINRSVSPVYKQVSGVLTFTGEYEITHVNYGEYDILGVLYPDNLRYRYMINLAVMRWEWGPSFVEVQNKGKQWQQLFVT